MLKTTVHKILKIIKVKLTICLLFVILLATFFVRAYRMNDLLGFYYDQGRDALVIWKLVHEGKPFLIGPITGLKGIYLGPFYYYLIAPFYLIGRGNSVVPAIFLSFLSTLAILMLFVLGKSMHSFRAGLFAAIIGTFSYYIVVHSRWLSNPNPILLTSLLLLYSMWKVIQKKDSRWWIGISLFTGLALQFESASAVFYLPAIAIFFIWQRSSTKKPLNAPTKKILTFSLIIFLITLLPQIVFNFRHQNILLKNFVDLFFKEKAFRGMSKFVFRKRLEFFWEVFSNKLYAGWHKHAAVFVSLSLSALLLQRKSLKKGMLTLFSIFLITPIIGYVFFQGNYGNIYDYYMSGYFLPFILLFAIGLAELSKTPLGFIAVIIFYTSFFKLNFMLLKNYLTAETVESRPIVFEDQMKAVNWVFEDLRNSEEFNLDVYVPPVIPHSYDYLFLWQATRRHSQKRVGCEKDLCGMVEEQVARLYTLYEEDPPHPERLEAWLDRQAGIGRVEEETNFGMVVVQRRRRL